MSLAVALDVATKHRIAADELIGGCDDRELGELIMSLLRLFDYAGKQMSSELGWLAIVSQLCRFANNDDWATATAASAIVAHQMMNQSLDTELRDHGSHLLQQCVDTANLVDRITDLVFAVVDIWRVLLPACEFDLLKHFVTQLAEAQ
jgi:hypothetical protein